MKIENDGQMGECLLAVGDYLAEYGGGEDTLGGILRAEIIKVICVAKEFSRQLAAERPAEAQPLTAEGIEANVRALMAEQQKHLAKVLTDVKIAVKKVGMPMPAGIESRPKTRKRKVSKRR